MKQSCLIDSCSYSKIFRFALFLISFCIFVTPNHARVVHRRLWPWPSRPWPFPGYQPQPWPLEPPAPSSPPKPAPAPGPAPCPPIPPKPQPKPPPVPSTSPCPPIPPKPQPKPPPAPSPGPSPCPPQPPKPQPTPSPSPKPLPPKPPGPKPVPPPTPSPKPVPPPTPSPKPNPPAPSPKAPNKTIPAVFFFGDSILDTGNNNNRGTRIKSNYRPYGMDFPMGVATGRFSNGKVASDYISKYLGVKEIVPAYLDQKLQQSGLQQAELQQSDLLTGVSFASGGAGYIPETSKAAKVIPMLDQLTYFQDYKERVRKLVGKKKTDQIVSKGAAIVVAGGNDIMYTYFGSGGQSDKKDVDAFTTVMADSAASFVLQLYGYGARRIGVVGTPPLGCTPSQRVKKKKKCNEELNYASQLFNSKLLIILGELSKTLPNSTLVYMDIYSIMSHMLETPSDFGFEEVKKPCCKISKIIGGGVFCKKSTSKICPNTSSYVFWDGVHPTQRAYKTLNKILIKEYIHVLSN